MIRGGHSTATSRTPYVVRPDFYRTIQTLDTCRYYLYYVMKLFGAFLFPRVDPEREQRR